MKRRKQLNNAAFMLPLVVVGMITGVALVSVLRPGRVTLVSGGECSAQISGTHDGGDMPSSAGTADDEAPVATPEADLPALLLRRPETSTAEGETETQFHYFPVMMPGRVVDPSGRPVSGAEVRLDFPEAEDRLGVTRTDANGRFLLQAPTESWFSVSTCSFFISACHDGDCGAAELYFCAGEEQAALMRRHFPELLVYIVDHSYANAADHPVITLTAASSVRGIVVDEYGAPLAGIPLSAARDRGIVKKVGAVSGPDGAYAFHGLLPGLWEIIADTGSVTDLLERYSEPVRVAITAGVETEAPPLRHHTKKYPFSGRVTDRRGRPVPGASISILPLFYHGLPGEEDGIVHAGTDGTFRFPYDVPAGNYVVMAGRGRQVRRIGQASIAVPCSPLQIRLEEEIELRGQVTDAETGLAVPRFQTLITPEYDRSGYHERVVYRRLWPTLSPEEQHAEANITAAQPFEDDLGRFRLGFTGPGLWRLQVFAPGYACLSVPLQLDRDAPVNTISLALTPNTGEAPGPERVFMETVQELMESRHTLEFSYDEEGNNLSPSVEQGADGWLDIQVNDHNGETVLNPEIHLFNLSEPFCEAQGVSRVSEDSHQGVYQVPPGRYRIYGFAPYLQPCLAGRVMVAEVQVEPGRRHALRLTPPRGPVTLAGEVRVDGFTPLSGEVLAMTASGNLIARGNIDDGGRFLMTDMPPGQVLLRLQVYGSAYPGIPVVSSFRSLILPRKGLVKSRITIQDRSLWSGRIAGKPVGARADLMVFPPGMSDAAIFSLDDRLRLDAMRIPFTQFVGEDTFTFHPLAAGRYTFAAALPPQNTLSPKNYYWAMPGEQAGWLSMPLELPLFDGEETSFSEFTLDVSRFQWQNGSVDK